MEYFQGAVKLATLPLALYAVVLVLCAGVSVHWQLRNSALQISVGGFPMSHSSIREVRERIVQEHLDAENRQDAQGTVNTFHSARYEIFPVGAIADGPAAVHELLSGLFAGFPDFHVEATKIYHSDDAVIMEVEMSGTQNGPFAGLSPSGRKMKVPLVAICVFEADRMICEKVYYDMATVMQQLSPAQEEA